MPATFTIDDKQLEAINAWKAKLPVARGGAIGGRFTYCFTPTSLGEILVVKDEVTKEEINVTDFDSW